MTLKQVENLHVRDSKQLLDFFSVSSINTPRGEREAGGTGVIRVVTVAGTVIVVVTQRSKSHPEDMMRFYK